MERRLAVAEPKNTKGRVLYYSVLNVMACLGVVILHCNSVALGTFTQKSSFYSAFLIHSVLYWPVPIFFMLSGATLLDYRERYDTKLFVRKRFLKTVIPFLAWSIIAMIWWSIWKNNGVFDLNPVHIIDNIFNTRYINHYWFFIPLFGIYLAMPIFSAVHNKISVFKYASILGIIFISILPLVCEIFGISFNNYAIPPVLGGGGFILYTFLGYCLSKISLSRKWRLVIYVCGIFGFCIYYFGTLLLISMKGYFAQTFLGVCNLPLVLISMAFFVCWRYFDFDSIIKRIPKFSTYIANLASLTFGIYLIHGFFTETLPWLLGFSPYNIVWRTIGGVGVFVLCALLVKLLKKVPIINRIVP